MPDLPPLVLRADADARLGSGHLMRCLALALEWKRRGGKASFISRCDNEAWRARVEDAGLALTAPGADDLAGLSDEQSWLVIDGYDFDAGYLQRARERASTLVIDDFGHRPAVHGHALLNQNLGAERRPYELDADTLPLLGPKYALLRPEFSRQPPRRFNGPAKRVLVSLGGSDPDDVTAKAVAALPRGAEAVVVLGAAYTRKPAPREGVRFERDVPEISKLMAWADVAVLAGGTTAWEACFMGLPSVMLVLTDNQREVADQLDAAGAAELVGEGPDVSSQDIGARLSALAADSPRRAAMSAQARRFVDGRGAARVCDALVALSTPKLEGLARLRPMAEDDVYDVWRLANEPSVRANSFNREPIPLEDHVRWFKAQLGRDDARFWAVEAGGVLAGQVRCERQPDGSAEVHFSVRGAFQGKGLGAFALTRLAAQARRALKASLLRGVVIAPNPASERAFARAGYARKTERTIRGKSCVVFEKSCS